MPLKLIRRKDSPSWWLRGSVRGISVYESTKIADRETAEAIRILRERELLDESMFGKKINVTFEEAAASYLKRDGSGRFLVRLREELGGAPLRKIRQSDLDAVAHRLYPDSTPETRNRQCYTPFIAVWNHAARNEWTEPRLWQRPKRRKGTARRAEQTRAGSLAVAYDRASIFVSHLPPAPAMVMTALFYTGLRPIELFFLARPDVDIEKRWIVVRSSKTGEGRGVPLHEFLVPMIESLLLRRDREPEVFRSFTGRPYVASGMHGGQLSSSLDSARRRISLTGSSIDDVSPYTARHSVSTQLVINGVHPHVKDQILGHAVDSMSRHYTHVPQAQLIEAINSLPVPALWRNLTWWKDPLCYSRRHRWQA